MVKTRRRIPRYLREEQPAEVARIEQYAYSVAWDPYWQAAKELRAGNPEPLASAVAYLLEQPRFFGSGYLFEELAAAVAVGPDAGPLADDLREVVLRAARLPIRRETRRVARVAARYWTEELAAQLHTIERGASRRLLLRAPEIRKSYRRLGLITD